MSGDSAKIFLQTIFTILWLILKFGWPLFLLLAFLRAIGFARDLYRDSRLQKAGIEKIDQMNGKDFEIFLSGLFRQLGYSVRRTPYTGDFGGDLVLSKDGIKTVVQAKRYGQNVGNKAIQEVVAAKAYYKAERAMVVTNSGFTDAAIRLAKANDVELWGRTRLIKAILDLRQKTA